MNETGIVFVIGFPSALARSVVAAIGRVGGTAVRLLAPTGANEEAQGFAQTLDIEARVVEGDVSRIDFGMSGSDYLDLAEEVTSICGVFLPPPPGVSGAYEVARAAAREVLELAQAAPRLNHVLVLSHLDVAGSASSTFAERDLELGQSFSGVDQEERFRAERIYRRFADRLPLSVVRCGWITGQGRGNCPLVHLLLSIADEPGKEGERPLMVTEGTALAEALAGMIAYPPSRGGRTLHMVSPNVRTTAELATEVRELAGELVPAGFDLVKGARRLLRRGGQTYDWSYREFFKRQPGKARFESALTERFLEEHGLPRPELDQARLAGLVENAVEEIVGFK
ncbi:MAG: SDR family oxidoreductase [Deltaproteobacteria bacterium]|nr:SDR family oxidoreductase [Deltaproteobacteria bacterium]